MLSQGNCADRWECLVTTSSWSLQDLRFIRTSTFVFLQVIREQETLYKNID